MFVFDETELVYNGSVYAIDAIMFGRGDVCLGRFNTYHEYVALVGQAYDMYALGVSVHGTVANMEISGELDIMVAAGLAV